MDFNDEYVIEFAGAEATCVSVYLVEKALFRLYI